MSLLESWPTITFFLFKPIVRFLKEIKITTKVFVNYYNIKA